MSREHVKAALTLALILALVAVMVWWLNRSANPGVAWL